MRSVAAKSPHPPLWHRLSAALLTFATAGLAQQPVPVAPKEKAGFDAIRESTLRANLAFISSDALAGRLSLTPGDASAVEWIASEFAKAGLMPIATDAAGKPGFLQSFQLVEYRPDRPADTLTLLSTGASPGETIWHAPQALGAYKDDVDLLAPVVFAGYGITAPELGYDDYRNIDAKGKIVLIFDHEPQEEDAKSIFNGTGNTRYATSRVKTLNAQAHGAIAVLLVAEPNRKHLTNSERAAKIGGSITRAIPLPLQAINEDELHIPGMLVTDEVAAKLLQGATASPSALQAAIDKDLTPQSQPLPGTNVAIHLKNATRTIGTTWNVAGLLPGSDPSLAPETIIISAHHDHDGESPVAMKMMDGPTIGMPKPPANQPARPPDVLAPRLDIWHGADDNGSGTVGVVELAHAFALNPVRPRRSILFVVFASEERGLLGAYWMAAHPLRPLATTRAMINFDMIGRNEAPSPQTDGLITIPADTTNRLNLIGALYSPDYNRIVQQENRHVGLVLDDRFDHESALNVFFRSDQFPFVLKDVPAFWWFTGFHPDYHHTTDTAEKINYAKMVSILKLAYLSAWNFGDAQTVPRFIANPGAFEGSKSK